ncbi:MAG: ABC transporter ATP-binding protein [Clostridia bacterium]|nr:ABC transporter ATP-binding protein [Clostridia bacterium]
MSKIIEVRNLKKYFGDIKAVDDLSFDVEKGSLFAFLGLNGAGKSTTINIICGDLEKDSGEVFVSGKNIDKDLSLIKSMLGVVYQESVLDKQLTVKDNLECRAVLYGLNKVQFQERLIQIDKLFSIKELLSRPVGKLSGGQRRRVDIARAILHNPQILILDEPTTGLDPQTRKMVWSAVEKLRKENEITVFLTTHYMEEVTDADNVVILDSGKIVASGSPLQLKTEYSGDYIRLYNAKEEDVKLLKMPYKKLPECFVIEVKNSKEATNLILKNPELFSDYEIVKGKMDDVFLTVTGKSLVQGGENA